MEPVEPETAKSPEEGRNSLDEENNKKKEENTNSDDDRPPDNANDGSDMALFDSVKDPTTEELVVNELENRQESPNEEGEENSKEGERESEEGDGEESEEEEEGKEEESAEDESDDECGDSPLENLTLAQLETLLSKKEREQKRAKKRENCLIMAKEWIELKKKRTIHEEETLAETIKQLQEQEAYLENLMKRISCIKKFMKTPEKHRGAGRLDASSFPQVILCSPWEDSRVPKVVVCSTPREGKMDCLTKEFLKVLSPEQLAIIEKEKKWMAIECGKVRLQIAGIKGKIRVVTRENDVLKTLIDTTDASADIKVIMPDDKMPCYGATGVPDRAKSCPKYAPKQVEEVPIEIKLNSMAVSNKRNTGEEIRYVEKKIKELQEDLNKAIQDRLNLAAQKVELQGGKDGFAKAPPNSMNGQENSATERHSTVANIGSSAVSLSGMT